MHKPLLRGALVVLAICFASHPVRAENFVIEAQRLLNSLGYDAGPADGAAGKRTIAAMSEFLEGKNVTFDGTVDEPDLELLRASAAEFAVVLRRPGKMLQIGDGACKNLSVGRYRATPDAAVGFPPVAEFNDSQSIGTSAQRQAALAFEMALLVNAAAAAGGDKGAADFAKIILLNWARADAGLGTAVDNRYLGKGNAEDYDANAAAPALDMENAAQLGAAGLMALEMLEASLSTAEQETVREWALELVKKYDLSEGLLKGGASGVFMSAYPRLLGAIAEGDDDTYRTLVEANYDLLRERIDKNGAILKNANRGDRGLHYQSMGILVALSLFELVENQGSKIPPDVEADLHRAVTFLLEADRDNSVILPYAKMGFNNPGRGTKPVRHYRTANDHYWWMVAYIARYPDSENATRLRAFLGRNDTAEHVDRNVMPATWAAYPINCFVDYDLSPTRVQDAIAYVDANYPKVIAPPSGGMKMGKPKTKGAQAISFDSTSVMMGSRDANFESFSVIAKGLKINGEKAPVQGFTVFADFGGGSDDMSNLILLRIVGYPTSLQGGVSMDDFVSCGNVAAQDGSFRLHIGEHDDYNSCILKKMVESDRIGWASILDGFEAIINDGDPEQDEARGRLKAIYDYMVY
jgi:hypothetical protein